MLIIAALLAELVKLKLWLKLNANYLFNWKEEKIIKHKNLLPHIKIGNKIWTFGNIEIEKGKFYCCKSINLEYVDIKIILLTNKIYSGE